MDEGQGKNGRSVKDVEKGCRKKTGLGNKGKVREIVEKNSRKGGVARNTRSR